ncbi:TIGR02678 family protein [Acididesulfobacillus acetoxydans]|uniref:TIGR02678 family protein n=1 Tax=Acididesulfobacillus acetoxydans TaxID=1561005 RepID=A0A8S0W809_9FIRM|nr:TIGR02678 family protein [Acididesulfobacillus acetoxydans]CAA7601359.1 TIGR02678 family protein [Acididesulfobacillus acetoxydans]CEJ06024.1 TIGR02678 protein [Acididesulfobacillus acetoxydans]
MSDREFDETARVGLKALLENFWIIREEDPETYQLIRDREKTLRQYVLDKLGYHLIVHRHFAKLEKIPARPEAWMGIETFQRPLDYAILACVLAYLENKSVDEQFLLSDLCSELVALFPVSEGEPGLDWRHYEQRKSLVRVLQFMDSQGLLRVVDGETGAFNQSEESEVLYEATVMARYFMRSYPKDLFRFQSKEELLAADLEEGDDESGSSRRRNRVYRQLLLSPAMYREEMEEGDFLYLRNFRRRLLEDIEFHTGRQLELYRHTAMVVAPEYDHALTLFPDQKGITDLILQWSGELRRRWDDLSFARDAEGCPVLTPFEFEQEVRALKTRYSAGWSKKYREGLIQEIARELLTTMRDWKMAEREKETGRIRLRPALLRLEGEYPEDFRAEEMARGSGGESVD